MAREATAEALARAYERWEKVGRMDSPAGWVHTTAVNLCRRSWRRRALERRALEKQLQNRQTGNRDGAGQAATETRLVVHPLVESLPPRMQQAVRYRYWGDMSEREIAKAMGISEGATSALLSQARKRLGGQLERPVGLGNRKER